MDYTPKAEKWSEAELQRMKSGLLPVEATSINRGTIAERNNEIYKDRSARIALNVRAYHGGKPYIDSRLSRFPSESDVDWAGDIRTNSDGRKQRAYLINYCQRIATKINQFVFSEGVRREGVDAAFAADVTTTGIGLNQFMADVSAMITACRWCWVSVDRPIQSENQSIADRERNGDRVFWRLYTPLEVVDWKFDPGGRLLWLLTEETEIDDESPYVEPKKTKIRKLYANDVVQTFYFDDKNEITSVSSIPNGIGKIPFVPCGVISSLPWWFDDVERIQKVQLDRGSAYDTALHQACYPQPVLPSSILDDANDISQKREVRYNVGIKSPVLETAEEAGITRFEVPDFSSLSAMRDEIDAGEKQIFEIVGLAMSRPDTRQVESAEAKQWNHMDVECVIRERAVALEEVESKCIELSRAIDSTFKVYEPQYGRRFDVVDIEKEFAALLMTNNAVELPGIARKEIQRIVMHRLDKRFGIDPEKMTAIIDAIYNDDLYE